VSIADRRTSVLLDTATRSSVGLEVVGVSGDVIVPGSIEGSVAFDINDRDADASLLPTTFAYDAGDFLASFSGAIEHAGRLSLGLDGAPIEVGNFTIGFDAARIDAATGASGFFVASTVGVVAPLFDVAAPTELSAPASGLVIGADLLVSPELAGVIGDPALTGVDVADAPVEGDTDCSAADVNDNGFVAFFDFRLFVRQLLSADPAAAFNGDGSLDGRDFRAFINRYLDCRFERVEVVD
jgi:hypothetical protein